MRSVFFLAFLVLSVGALGISAQISPVDDEPLERGPQRSDRRDVLRELGLTPEQFEQMKTLNADVRSRRQAARARLIEATRELDRAIYADTLDDTVMAERLKEYQAAQAEIARINFENEYAVRKILTAEQLVRFREIRSRFGRQVDNFQRRREQRMRNRGLEPGMRPDVRRPAIDGRPVNNAKPARGPGT